MRVFCTYSMCIHLTRGRCIVDGWWFSSNIILWLFLFLFTSTAARLLLIFCFRVRKKHFMCLQHLIFSYFPLLYVTASSKKEYFSTIEILRILQYATTNFVHFVYRWELRHPYYSLVYTELDIKKNIQHVSVFKRSLSSGRLQSRSSFWFIRKMPYIMWLIIITTDDWQKQPSKS